MGAPKSVIIGPQAIARDYGLLATVDTLEGAQAGLQAPRWENGYSYTAEGCGAAGVIDPCNPGTKEIPPPSFIGVDVDGHANQDGQVTVEPFGVWAGDRCSTIGWELRDYQARAERLLAACQGKQIEFEFWTGTLAQAANWVSQPYLARDDTADIVGLDMAPEESLACLEQGLASCSCGPGIIHATPQLVTRWFEKGMVFRESGKVVTGLGTWVVPGAGYPGTGPTGQASQIWAYATGWVTVRLGPIRTIPRNMQEATDHEIDEVTFIAERLATVDFTPCCHIAVETDMIPCLIGGS